MLGYMEYEKSFKKGLSYVLYQSQEENRIAPEFRCESMEKLGYYDGYQYGEYLELTGQTKSISQEQLLAVIDKYHTKAYARYQEFLNHYFNYKNGFLDGKGEFIRKIENEDEDFSKLPEMEEGNDYSMGFHDGYDFFLKRFIFDSEFLLDLGEKTIQDSFQLRREKQQGKSK